MQDQAMILTDSPTVLQTNFELVINYVNTDQYNQNKFIFHFSFIAELLQNCRNIGKISQVFHGSFITKNIYYQVKHLQH